MKRWLWASSQRAGFPLFPQFRGPAPFSGPRSARRLFRWRELYRSIAAPGPQTAFLCSTSYALIQSHDHRNRPPRGWKRRLPAARCVQHRDYAAHPPPLNAMHTLCMRYPTQFSISFTPFRSCWRYASFRCRNVYKTLEIQAQKIQSVDPNLLSICGITVGEEI